MNPAAKLLLDANTGNIGQLTNGATGTSANIDLLDVDFAVINVSATTQSASTQAGSPSVLKIQESETTVVTSFADVVGFRGGSATATTIDFVIGIGRTSGVNAYQFNMDARARKRYVNVVVTPTTTQTFYVTANGFRRGRSPSSASEAGVLSLVEG
jgi:hypothetical protein